MIKRAILVVLTAGVVAIPILFVSGGADVYRLPKELLFRGEAIALLALMITVWRPKRRPEILLCAAIVVWTIIVTAASTNRALSTSSMITVIAAAAIFIAACHAMETLSLEAVDVLMIGASANAVVVVLQELKIWNPVPSAEGHYGSVGLLGNANDVGTFLVVPAVAAMVMAITMTGRRRWIYLATTLLLVGGIAASATRTALFAFVAAILVLAATQARRAAIAVGLALLLIGFVMAWPAMTIGANVRALADAAAKRDYPRLFSERLSPFLAAAEMTRDHPLVGVGPGCFKYHYMPYRLAFAKRYPAEWTRGYPMNWGEVHNDHLQVAAETGLVGYLLFLAAMALLVRRPARGGHPAPRRQFARELRWPLATAIFVVCLAQFPLELAAPRLMFIMFGALCVTWDRSDATI
jgi:O-antigen ligase